MFNISNHTLLRPAYGRKYSSEEDVESAFRKGLDFRILNGPYCSIRDFKPNTSVLLYFGNNQWTQLLV